MAARGARAAAELKSKVNEACNASRTDPQKAVLSSRTTRRSTRSQDQASAAVQTCDATRAQNTKGRKRKLPRDAVDDTIDVGPSDQLDAKRSKQDTRHREQPKAQKAKTKTRPSPRQLSPSKAEASPAKTALLSPSSMAACPAAGAAAAAEAVAKSSLHAAQNPASPLQQRPAPAMQPPCQAQDPPMHAATFNPSCPDHVAAVQRVLALSGSRGDGGSAPVGRQQQFQQLHDSLSSCCVSHSGRSIYVSGLPGTGKSFTVQRAASSVCSQQRAGAPAVCVITINCMALADSRDVYAALLDRCSQWSSKKGSTRPPTPPRFTSSSLGGPDAAHDALVALLQAHNKHSQGAGKRGGNGAPGPLFILVLEEVDRLLGRGPEEMYKLFMLPHTPGLHVALVTIANSLDLTERLLPALKCRGVCPDFVSFPAYSKSQVQNILASTMQQLPWKVFEDVALELVARTVSGTTGDLRHAFKMCSTALEALVECQQCTAPAATAAAPALGAARSSVGLKEMVAAVRSLSGSGTSAAAGSAVATVKALPNQQQLALLAASMVVATAGAEAADAAARRSDGSDLPFTAAVSFAAPSGARPGPGRSNKWKHLNPFSAQPAACGEATQQPGQAAAGGGAARVEASSAMTADAAMRVPLTDVYARYCGLCKELFMRPVPLPEFCQTCGLLGEQALLALSGTGQGGRGRAAAAAPPAGSQHRLKVSLRVLGKDIKAALKANPIYKKVIGAD